MSQGSRVSTDKINRFLDELRHDLPEVQEKVVRASGFQFTAHVTSTPVGESTLDGSMINTVATPVDTGRARAGWASFAESEGHPIRISGPHVDGGEVEKGKKEGRHDFQSDDQGASLQIRNAVPHIVPLEYGHSEQAPGGFARIALRRMRQPMKAAALEELRDKMAAANAKATALQTRFKG